MTIINRLVITPLQWLVIIIGNVANIISVKCEYGGLIKGNKLLVTVPILSFFYVESRQGRHDFYVESLAKGDTIFITHIYNIFLSHRIKVEHT